MKRTKALLLLLLPLALTAQPLPQDTTYRTGRLDNGMTYYIRHNAKEAGIADFYIAQRVGSILEEPRQRGLAHFLEHMAFNGSENFKGTPESPSIVHWCELHGVKFGANLNAYTSVDETVYHVSAMPVNGGKNIDSTLLILHDWSHYLDLTDKEIDKERGVIHEEWRSRLSAMAIQQLMEKAMPIVYKGSKYEDCLPIGSMDIVDHFPYQDLRDYYHKWYRPDLQAIIVVGDINVDEVEQKIKKVFSPIPMPANPAKRIYYPVADNDSMIVAYLRGKEQPIMLVNLYMKRDATPDSLKNSEQYLRESYIDNLISYMLGDRLDDMQDRDPKPCLSATARLTSFFISRTKDAFTLSFGARQENIRGSFDAAVGTVEQVRQHGFTESELQRAKAFRQKFADKQYNIRNDRRNSYFVSRAQQNFLDSEPLISEAENKELTEKFGREVTLDEVNRAMREAITDKNQVLIVYSPDKDDYPTFTNEELEKFVVEAQQRQYPEYEEKALATNLIDNLPTPGRIVSERPSIHGTTEMKLSNGVTVYFRQTDYNKDQVLMRFYGEGGTSLYPDSDYPSINFIGSAIKEGGLGSFSQNDLGKVLAGKTVKVNAGIGDQTQAISGTSSPKDLKTMMELTYLYFTSLRRDDKSFASELDRMKSFLTNREANHNVSYNDSVAAILYGNSPRVKPIKAESIEKVSYDRILQIYKEQFSNASNFKMIILGNISIDSLRPLLCQYIATLPSTGKKETFASTWPDIRKCNETHRWTHEMDTPLAKVSIFYTWGEPYDSKTDLHMDFLRRVLSIAYTDSVREEKGGVYGVSVETQLDKTSNPDALMKISFNTDPDKYDMVIPIIYRQIENIAKYGPLESSMQKVKEYLVKQYDQVAITNDYWNYIVYSQLRFGVDFDKDYKKLVSQTTAKDIQRLAQDLLKSNNRIEVTMVSK